jgi:hypothetical protein
MATCCFLTLGQLRALSWLINCRLNFCQNSSYKRMGDTPEIRTIHVVGKLWLDLDIAFLQPFLTARLENARYPSQQILQSLAEVHSPDLA